MLRDLQDRIERARSLKLEGYNCCQCVVMAFDDLLGMADDEIAKVTVAFGGGFGGSHNQLCGTVSAIGIVSAASGFSTPADKKLVYGGVTALSDRFRDINGSIICKELLASRKKPCMGLIEDAVTVLHESLSHKEG